MSQKELNLRQHQWLELLKDYDLIIDYHLSKTNVVADALSWKSLFTLKALNTCLALVDDGLILAELKVKPILYFRNRMCVPKNYKAKQEILLEAHSNSYSIHPGSNKMYNDLNQKY
ncbi:DNA/RNA polymerases superfamily protein [Gossypium australe]|uniref:DNA/RNA polymerases superfamily protein n=1 Tax=Gossypium australe TaxID=47621 RepID=A0A5B6VLX0_9ROSI|nr:DNA/RNA polymerases superfamily protein [Gossypium australe]